jgi:hypothetical protein
MKINESTQIGLPLSKSYWKPTPKLFRIIGDVLLSVGTFGTIIEIHNPLIATICVVSGFLGKLITNCVSIAEK